MKRAFNLLVFVYALAGIVLALLLSGCGGVPQSLSLDPTFTPAEVAAIGDARDQWCSLKGWCPYFVTDGEAHIIRDETMSYDPAPGAYNVAGNTDHATNRVIINAKKASADPDMFWIMIAHEMGHLQNIEHHGHLGDTMFWEQNAPAFELVGE